MLLPIIIYHIRLYTTLSLFEKQIHINFRDKDLLKKV